MKCADCAKWEGFMTHEGDRGYCYRKEPVRCCEPVTWADACCPAFEAQKDWAQRCAESYFDDPADGDEDVQRFVKLIRAAAKAHFSKETE